MTIKLNKKTEQQPEKLQLSLLNPLPLINWKKHSCNGPLNLFQFVASSIKSFGRRFPNGFRGKQAKRFLNLKAPRDI